jgi:hypothetical protein
MHFLINEQSFIGQAKHHDDADKLMIVLFEIIKELEPIKSSKPILTHSSFFSCHITVQIKVSDWLHQKSKSSSGEEQETSRILLIKLMNKGPFIDDILDEELDFYECHFNNQDVCGSSLAGAAYLQGTLISLQGAPDFVSQSIQLRYSQDGIGYKEIEITNLTHVSHAKKLRPRYVPRPKHAQGGFGTLMDLSDEVAQAVLEKGIVSGRQIYGYYDGNFYEFQFDNFVGFHGYPVDENKVPYKVIEHFKNLPNK